MGFCAYCHMDKFPTIEYILTFYMDQHFSFKCQPHAFYMLKTTLNDEIAIKG